MKTHRNTSTDTSTSTAIDAPTPQTEQSRLMEAALADAQDRARKQAAATEESLKLRAELLAKFRAEHPRGIRPITLSDGRLFVFRKATRVEFMVHKSQLMQIVTAPAVAANANTALAQSLLIFPTMAEFTALCESDPDVVDEIGMTLAGDVGTGVSIAAGKAEH